MSLDSAEGNLMITTAVAVTTLSAVVGEPYQIQAVLVSPSHNHHVFVKYDFAE